MKKNSFFVLLCSVCWAFLLSISCLMVLTYLVYQFELETQLVDAVIIIIYIVANLLAGIFIGFLIPNFKIVYSIFSGIIYVLILQLFSMLITGIGFLDIGLAQISTGFLCVIGNLIGCLIGNEPNEHKNSKLTL